MTWVRWGDTSANHPIPLAVLEHEDCDDRLLNEVHGWISRCAAQSGAHLTDYVISRGTAVSMAGHSRVDVLVEVALFAGYITQVQIDGRIAYKLTDADHDFLHLRLRAEVEWERQRRSDNSNPALIVPVRMRDGDACRWCGKVVNWAARNGNRCGTYDHLEPGKPATVETYVVACGGCNSSRGDGTNPGGQRTLLPAPSVPYFSQHSVDWFAKNQWAANNGYTPPARSRKTVKPGDPAPHMVAPSTSLSPAPAESSAPAGERTGTQPATAGMPDLTDAPAPRPDTTSGNATSKTRTDSQSAHAPKPAMTSEEVKPVRNQQVSSGRWSEKPDGSGRDGTGLDGSGRVGAAPGGDPPPTDRSPPPDAPRQRSRGRRRRKPRGAPPAQPPLPPSP